MTIEHSDKVTHRPINKSAENSQPVPPPFDINKPVENPKLVAAIERLIDDSSENAKDHLLIELNKANYLAAIFSDEMHVSEPDKNGKATIEKDSIIKLITTTDEHGNMYLPLFTDWNAIGKYIDKPVDTIVLPAPDAWTWALEMGKYHGVVINPAHNALPLNHAQIEYLLAKVQPANDRPPNILDKEKKRQLKKIGKAEVARRSDEVKASLREANPARPGSDLWAKGYKKGTNRERWLRHKQPTLHSKRLNKLFVIRKDKDSDWSLLPGGYVQCELCGSALPSNPVNRKIYFSSCKCGNIRWNCFFRWRKVTVKNPDKVIPIRLIGRG